VNTISCRELREAWELFQDGALDDLESRAISEHLGACEPCSSWCSEDFLLAERLRRTGVAASGGGWWARSWRRVAVGAAAAAAAVVLGFVLGWSSSAPGGSTESLRPLGEGEILVADSGAPILRGLSGGALRIMPGATMSFEGGVARLRRGTFGVESLTRPTPVLTPFGRLLITGSAMIHVAPAPDPEDGLVTVTLLEGRGACVHDGGETPLALHVPLVLRPADAIPLGDLLRRYVEIVEDEALVVMSSSEALAFEGRYLAEIAELEQRIGELMGERSRLRLERGALRSRLGDDPRPLRGAELVAAAALSLMQAGSEEAGVAAPTSRHLLALLEGSDDDLLPAVSRHLLGAEASGPMKVFGLRLLARIGGEGSRTRILEFIDVADPQVRFAAVDALSRQRSASSRPVLERVLDEDPDLACRVGAAGGLVLLGDLARPLEWLMDTWRGVEAVESGVRSAVLGRILQAPVARIAPFLAEVASDPLVSRQDRRDLVDILGELGGPEAVAVLDFLLLATEEPEERAYIDLTLSSMGG
jgi:hypothetical protein